MQIKGGRAEPLPQGAYLIVNTALPRPAPLFPQQPTLPVILSFIVCDGHCSFMYVAPSLTVCFLSSGTTSILIYCDSSTQHRAGLIMGSHNKFGMSESLSRLVWEAPPGMLEVTQRLSSPMVFRFNKLHWLHAFHHRSSLSLSKVGEQVWQDSDVIDAIN